VAAESVTNGTNPRQNILVLLSKGDGTFQPPDRYPAGQSLSAMVIADLDGDGAADLGTGSADAMKITIHLNDGKGRLAGSEVVPADSFTYSLATGDFNGDGLVDLASQGDDVQLHFNPGPQAWGAAKVHLTSQSLAGIADLDGDSFPELLSLDWSKSSVVIFWNAKGAQFGRQEIALGQAPFSLAVLDLEGDGYPEVAAAGFSNSAGGSILLFPNHRALPRSQDQDQDGVPDECAGMALFHRGDADGDGSTALADAVGLVGYLFLAGAGPDCAESADANNDGAIDITDAVTILNYLFLAGAPPAEPGPPPARCGPDTDPLGSPGDLGCLLYRNC